MSLTGDWSRLERLTRALDAVADGNFSRGVLADVAPVLSTLIGKGFDNSRRPTGQRWRRLKQPRARGRPNKGGPLYDSGWLRSEAMYVLTRPGELVIFVRHPGANVHQYGHGPVPARPYLPTGKALPGPWQRQLNAIATARWRALLTP